ncbi:hypothetical protein Sme01_65480 [Sphaerisporangium melleum]|uniref:Uncharacterized protein n=1 Tax=Sphaerisporangium melleum TaxID=321316 RepID=A0A917RER3_9ACTN|nr:hypothetical protein [Sphaerisporangium melleum]GGL03366.1 hypothetical protein GCM10007964_51820 [Sphaerisporangium melleum]GII74072.1 hypothetical protein Sme01_65480 [Sphaerisporangium melleum]
MAADPAVRSGNVSEQSPTAQDGREASQTDEDGRAAFRAAEEPRDVPVDGLGELGDVDAQEVLRWPGVWRVHITTRADEIRADAGRCLAVRPGDPGLRVLHAAVESHLAAASRYAHERQGWRRWLTGQAIEAAWSNLYGATILLYGLLPGGELNARAPEVLATGQAYLPADDARLVTLAARIAAGDIGERDRSLLQAVLRAAYGTASIESGRVRSFRNLLLGGAATLTLIVAGLVTIGAIWPTALPMCGNGTLLASLGPMSTQMCPTGEGRPSHGDVPLVALIGMLGAALATATSLSTRSELSTRYSLAVAQNLLKAPAGVATAIIGLLILNSGFVPGFGGLSSQTSILVWAMVFGYGQQVVTRFVDQRADTLLNAASPNAVGSPPKR